MRTRLYVCLYIICVMSIFLIRYGRVRRTDPVKWNVKVAECRVPTRRRKRGRSLEESGVTRTLKQCRVESEEAETGKTEMNGRSGRDK